MEVDTRKNNNNNWHDSWYRVGFEYSKINGFMERQEFIFEEIDNWWKMQKKGHQIKNSIDLLTY